MILIDISHVRNAKSTVVASRQYVVLLTSDYLPDLLYILYVQNTLYVSIRSRSLNDESSAGYLTAPYQYGSYTVPYEDVIPSLDYATCKFAWFSNL